MLASTSATYSLQNNRLPKLVLPSFNAEPARMASFLGLYPVGSARQHYTISNVQKFNYFKAHLRNGTERVMAGCQQRAKNYKLQKLHYPLEQDYGLKKIC